MISIVVPVLNEAPRLPAMLDMLDAQTGEKQIILADGGSADETRVVAEGRALISFSANTRTKTAKLFFGDQCIFIRREVFERMGGYADMPLFEDWDLSRRMREFGRTAIIETPVVTSGRRIDVWGKPKCLIIWWGLSILYALGVSAERLSRYYAHVRDS